VGYGVSTERIAQYLNKIRQPFNVNLLAQEAALIALSDRSFLKRTQRVVWQGKKYFYKAFHEMGLAYVPSIANFVLVNVERDANDVFQACLKEGVIVRSMKSYGLNQYVRISIGKPEENKP
jgi:histidinol-phosphate aminotransferase